MPQHPRSHPDRAALRRVVGTLALASALAAACSADGHDAAPTGEEPLPESPADTDFQGRHFERNVVFVTTGTDSTILVPWLIEARTLPGRVERRARGFLVRAGAWNPFFEDSWSSAPTRAPQRILPRGNMRLVVGEMENLDRIVFEDGARQLQVVLGDAIVEWSGQRGESFRLVNGALLLSNQRTPGLVLDMALAYRADDPPPGDWALLVSGDSLQVVLHRPAAGALGEPGAWRGWARDPAGATQLPPLTVEWAGTRSFDQARRDIPGAWTFRSADGEIEGRLEIRAAHLGTGEGEGPQLPVDALFQVEGTISVQGDAYPLVGLLRHEQG